MALSLHYIWYILVWCASDYVGNHFCFGMMYEWVTLFIKYCHVLLILCNGLRNGRTGHTKHLCGVFHVVKEI